MKWRTAGAVLSVVMLAGCLLTSGCMMSSAGVRQWNGERVADQLATIQARIQSGDTEAQASAAVDMFAVAQTLQGGFMSDWWAYVKANPWPAIWRGGVDLGTLGALVWGGYALADDNDSGGSSTPAIPAGTVIGGDYTVIKAGGNVEYNRATSRGEGPATAQ